MCIDILQFRSHPSIELNTLLRFSEDVSERATGSSNDRRGGQDKAQGETE